MGTIFPTLFPALTFSGAPALARPPGLILWCSAMVFSRKPIEIIAESLAVAVDDTFEVAEDIIADLEEAGWRFVFVPEAELVEAA